MRKPLTNRVMFITGIIFLLFLVGIGTALSLRVGNADSTAIKSAMVVKENLSLQIFERGLISPAKVEPIKSGILSNQALLVWAIAEGEAVYKDQIVARFDTKPFNDKRDQAEQLVADVQATLAATQKVLSMKKVALAGRLEAAKRKLDITIIKKKDLLHGSGQLKLKKFEQAMVQADRALKISQLEMDDMDVLFKKGHVSRRERDRTANDLIAAKEKLSMATAEKENFTRYEWPRLVREARLIVDAAREELSQEQLTSELEIQRTQGEIVKLQRDLSKENIRLKNARSDVAACNVSAPISGILLYKELPRNDGRRKVQIGDAIWVGQTFMEIPDTSEMIVKINIREIDVAKLQKGAKAEIHLDSIPERTFLGEIEYIDSLARADVEQGVRSFQTRISIKEVSPKIYPGMSASVYITYQELTNVLTIPLEAVSYMNGSPIVFLKEKKSVSDTAVKIGAISKDRAVILQGLTEGDYVLLDKR